MQTKSLQQMRRALSAALFFLLLNVAGMSDSHAQSTVGTDFWVTFLPNYDGNINISLIAAGSTPCTGTITNPYTNWSTSFEISVGATTIIDIPLSQSYSHNASDCVLNTALHVETTDTISLYASNFKRATFDVTDVLPTPSLGSSYIIQTYPGNEGRNALVSSDSSSRNLATSSSEFTVIAVEDNTTVNINLTGNSMNGHYANQPFSVSLNAGQCYQVMSVVDGNLSGSQVTALGNKKVAVFAGNSCANVPTTCAYCDHIVEQMLPVSCWGSRFVVTGSSMRSYDMVRVTSLNDGCQIFINNSHVSTINHQQTYQFEISSDNPSLYLETTEPSMVYLYYTGSQCGGSNGDPSMVMISPIEQRMNNVTFSTFNSGTSQYHFVNVVTNTEDVSSMQLDGDSISSHFQVVPNNSGYSFARIQITHGTHTLSTTGSGFVAHVYGLGPDESYAYSVGSNLLDLSTHILVNGHHSTYYPNGFDLCTGETVNLGLHINYSFTQALWDFGDGNTGSGSPILHQYDVPGDYIVSCDLYKQRNGQDTLVETVTTEVHVYESYESEFSITNLDTYAWLGEIYTSSGDYVYYGQTINGCDSLITLHLTINHEITADVVPEEGGTVEGTGIYEHGANCILMAFPNNGYSFSGWIKNGEVVSTSPTIEFNVTESTNYIANYSLDNHIITAIVNPQNGGTISGAGSYFYGSQCTLTVTPNENFIFLNWTNNDSIVSTDATYSFTVTESGNYVAHFVRALPELHVTGITHSSLAGGQQATISWTVQNDGTAATPNGTIWYDRVWLSVESRVAAGDNNPILLGTFENISALDVGEYYVQTQSVDIPLEVSGDYFLFVLTDAYDAYQIFWENNEVPIPYNPPPYIGCLSHHCPSGCPNVSDNRIYELSEYEHGDNPGLYYNDNFFYELVDIAVPLVPDLQVTSIIAPDNFFSGTNVNVTTTITNAGEVTTPNANWTDALYFSQEPDFNTAACLAMVAHSGALAVDSSYQVTFTGHIPLTVFGEAYFFVKTDIYEQVYEHVNNHNNMTMSNPVNIILTPPADLEPSELVVPVAVSTAENLSYSFKVTNVGAGNPNVTSWVDKVYISTEDTFGADAILLNTHYHYGNLTPTAYYSIDGSVALPSNVNTGFYYVYVAVDANNAVFEYLNEENDHLQSSLISVTTPDLQISEMTVPEQITSGYPINLSYTLANNGEGDIINRSITDRILISKSGNPNNAIEIANMRHNVNLPVGQSMTVTCNATAPTNLRDGTVHLIVVTDSNNEIHESNEENNILSHYPMPVMHQPLPDMHPVSFNLPSIIQAGEVVNVDFDITNLGDLDLLNSNCTFDVYALQNGSEILCPMQSQTLPLGSNVSIGIGQTLHFVRSILVPASVTSACTTFKLYADKENRITESNERNNTIMTNASVTDCPLPDLTVSNFTLPTMQAGTEAQMSFFVANQGTADFSGSFGITVYANTSGTQIQCPLRQQIAPETTNYNLAVGESLQFTLKVLVPPTVTSACNSFSVVVDATNTILETNENNNTANAAATVTNYPFNLTTQTFTVPSTVTAGETTNISWTVKNNGTCPNGQIPFYMKNGSSYTLVEGEYLPTPWKDKIYLSDDAVLSNNDIQLLAIDHNTVLHPNGTYSVEQTITLPYSAVGLKYLLCVSDATELTFDNNRSDNVVVVPVTVELGILPDLHLTALTVEPVMTSDNAYWVHYTVTNEGERVTQRDNWMDAFYIGQTYAVAGAFQLGSKIHNGALEVGASYTDSIEILLPSGLNGDYFLLGFTDATNLVFENTNEGNNLHGVTVTVVTPDPCDLIAIQPEFPNYAVSGEEMTVSWQLRNIGANPAVGRVRNAVYLSTDAAWSSDDVMLGYANVDISIAANQQQACSLSGSLTGIAEGNYYVIVKANILNALNESSYENNICVSLLTTEVGFPLLTIGEQVDRSMTSDQYIYYKLQVGPEYEGQTLSCTLTTMEQQVANGLYLSHETVPTLSQYNFGRYAPYAQEIEILIPALEQGDYYLLAKGSTQNGSPQQVSIATSIINFEILHIDADHGSNTGSITTKVTGAKFDSIMDFRLVQGGEYLPAEKVFFSNSTETYTTFDLVDMPAGTYAMEAELPGGIITIKGEAFTIEEGLPAELAVNIVAPSSVRRGNTFPVNIEYGNIGTTDLNVSGFVVVSRNGHPIGFTSDELTEGLTECVFSTAETNGNPDVLRPGYRATKTILVDANTLTSVSLQVYAIRKQY